MRLLIAAPRASEAGSLRVLFERRWFGVDVARDARAALERMLGQHYEIALVDAVLLERDDGSFVSLARRYGSRTLVLALCAPGDASERVRALDAGADDCLARPFAERELIARVNALARRAFLPVARDTVALDSLELDAAAIAAKCAGRKLPLSATEFRLLLYLVRNAGLTLTRGQIYRHVWERRLEGSTNVVNVYLGSLRRKLARAGCDVFIETVPHAGWRLRTPRAMRVGRSPSTASAAAGLGNHQFSRRRPRARRFR